MMFNLALYPYKIVIIMRTNPSPCFQKMQYYIKIQTKDPLKENCNKESWMKIFQKTIYRIKWIIILRYLHNLLLHQRGANIIILKIRLYNNFINLCIYRLNSLVNAYHKIFKFYPTSCI